MDGRYLGCAFACSCGAGSLSAFLVGEGIADQEIHCLARSALYARMRRSVSRAAGGRVVWLKSRQVSQHHNFLKGSGCRIRLGLGDPHEAGLPTEWASSFCKLRSCGSRIVLPLSVLKVSGLRRSAISGVGLERLAVLHRAPARQPFGHFQKQRRRSPVAARRPTMQHAAPPQHGGGRRGPSGVGIPRANSLVRFCLPALCLTGPWRPPRVDCSLPATPCAATSVSEENATAELSQRAIAAASHKEPRELR